MNHILKEANLDERYEYSQIDIAEKLFLAVGTVASTEKRAIEKFRQAIKERNINIKDYLND